MARGRILVVDDTGFNRMVIDRCLTSAGYKVIQASEGYTALQLLKSQPFDLVITDLKMAGLSGLELLIKTRAAGSESSPCPPFVLCTAIQEKDTIQTAILNGFSEILIKPVDRDKLLNLVQKHVRSSRETQSFREPEPDDAGEARTLQNLAAKIGASQEAVRNAVIEEFLGWAPAFEITSLEELHQKLREVLGEDKEEANKGVSDASPPPETS